MKMFYSKRRNSYRTELPLISRTPLDTNTSIVSCHFRFNFRFFARLVCIVKEFMICSSNNIPFDLAVGGERPITLKSLGFTSSVNRKFGLVSLDLLDSMTDLEVVGASVGVSDVYDSSTPFFPWQSCSSLAMIGYP